MATHGRSKSTLTHQLAKSFGQHHPLRMLHRLDYGTRGPVLIAKTAESASALQRRWLEVQKIYHAWVSGAQLPIRGTLGFPLDDKPCRTSFTVLGHRKWAVHGQASLLEMTLHTGRTHQIRRHLSALGHPIVGDTMYGHAPHYVGQGLHLTCTQLSWPKIHESGSHCVVLAPAKKMRRAVQGQFHQRTESQHLQLFEAKPMQKGL